MSRIKAARTLFKGIARPVRNMMASKIRADRQVIRAGKQVFGKNFEGTYRSATSYKKNFGRLTSIGVVKSLWDDRKRRSNKNAR